METEEYIIIVWTILTGMASLISTVLPKKNQRIVFFIFTLLLIFSFPLYLHDYMSKQSIIFIVINFLSFVTILFVIRDLYRQSINKKWTYLTILTIYSIIFISNIAKETYSIWNIKTKLSIEYIDKIFPQIASKAYLSIHTWNSNGKAKYEIFQKKSEIEEFFLTLDLQVWGNNCSDGAGLMIIPFPVYNISKANFIEFLVRGKHSGEIIGLSLKDENGDEIRLEGNIGEYCINKSITTHWQKCTVPLHKFKNVDRNLIENIAFYVNTELLSQNEKPQRLDIAHFRFR